MNLDRYKNAPLDLKVVGILSLVIVAASYVLALDSMKYYEELITPIVGWVPAIAYKFILILVFFIIGFGNEEKHVFHARLAVSAQFALISCFGISDLMSATPEVINSTNPYLRYSLYSPLYQIALPAILFTYIAICAYGDSKKEA